MGELPKLTGEKASGGIVVSEIPASMLGCSIAADMDAGPPGRGIEVCPRGAVRICWSTDSADFGRIEPEVEALVASLPGATPFDTVEWTRAALETLASGRAPRLLSARDADGRLLAAVAFTVGREFVNGSPLRTLRLLGSPYADRVSPPVMPVRGLAEQVLDALLALDDGWDLAILMELPADAPLLAAADGWARDRGIRALRRLTSRTPVVRLDVADPDALVARYSKSLRRQIRVARNRMNALGEVRFERRLPTVEETPGLLNLVAGIEGASWKGQRGTGIFSTPERRAFFGRVFEDFARRGWLDIGILSLGDRPIAYELGFRFRGVLWQYNGAFLPEHGALRPGRFLIDQMVRSSVTAGLDAVDSSRGSLRGENIMREWTKEAVEHEDLWIFGTSIAGRLAYFAQTRVRPALHRLRAISGGR